MVGALLLAAAVGAVPGYVTVGWLVGRSQASRVIRAGGWGSSAIIDNQRQEMNRSVVLHRHSPRFTRFRASVMGHLRIDKDIRFRPMPLSFIKGVSKFSLKPEQIVHVGCTSDSGVLFLRLQGDGHDVPISVRQPQGVRDALVRLLGQDRVDDYHPIDSIGTDPADQTARDPYREQAREA